jgi:hypothetical protein
MENQNNSFFLIKLIKQTKNYAMIFNLIVCMTCISIVLGIVPLKFLLCEFFCSTHFLNVLVITDPCTQPGNVGIKSRGFSDTWGSPDPCAPQALASNAWTEISKLPFALDDHSIDEGEEIVDIGQRVSNFPLETSPIFV